MPGFLEAENISYDVAISACGCIYKFYNIDRFYKYTIKVVVAAQEMASDNKTCPSRLEQNSSSPER